MSNHSIIEHRASYHFVKMEEDYLAICSRGECSPHCKALILAILEHWMNTKRDRGEGDYAYLTMPEWIKHMYMLYERNVIEDCIKELLKEGLIIRRPIKRYGQKTFEYTLNVDAIHELIKALPTKEANDTLPNLDNYVAHREKIKAEKKEVREKSRTSEVSEKSRRVREKSRTSSSGRYVKNHSNIDSITKITTEIEGTNADDFKDPQLDSTQLSDSSLHSSTQSSSVSLSAGTQEDTHADVEQMSTVSSELSTADVDKQAKDNTHEPNSTERNSSNPGANRSSLEPVGNLGSLQEPQVEQTTSHIATVTTSKNVEPLTTRNTSYNCDIPKQVTLTAEEQNIHDWWLELGYEADITSRLKEHWRKLAKHVRSFEQMKSLHDYTRERIRDDHSFRDKTVNPGNLANAQSLNGWKQAQLPPPEKPKPKAKLKITKEYLEAVGY